MSITLLEKLESLFEYNTSKAKLLIKTGQIYVNNKIINDINYKINDFDKISLNSKKEYVSRAAFKLKQAIESFNLEKYIKNKIILDIGSSTGGFCQVLLENGAKSIYALDVGTNQLDYFLRINPKIISLEKTNLKTINLSLFEYNLDFVTCDVSFISSKEVFKVLDFLQKGTLLLLLIKPQFEANSNDILPGGIAPLEIHNEIIEKVKSFALSNFELIKLEKCKIKGKKSHNIEYISLFERK